MRTLPHSRLFLGIQAGRVSHAIKREIAGQLSAAALAIVRSALCLQTSSMSPRATHFSIGQGYLEQRAAGERRVRARMPAK